jgi:hypothetical protein
MAAGRSVAKHVRECKVAYPAFAQFSLRGRLLSDQLEAFDRILAGLSSMIKMWIAFSSFMPETLCDGERR